MGEWKSPATIYLAHNPDGTETSVCWWYGWDEPTAYHGYWTTPIVGELFVCFHAFGTGVYKWEGERRLRGTHLHATEEPGIYKGEDHKKRKVTLKMFDEWIMTEGGVKLAADWIMVVS